VGERVVLRRRGAVHEAVDLGHATVVGDDHVEAHVRGLAVTGAVAFQLNRA
jgi:hypothetical protein